MRLGWHNRRTGRTAAGAVAAVLLTVLLTAATVPAGQQEADGGPAPDPTLAEFSHSWVTVEDMRLHYVIGGSGPPLVLLHGWPQTWWTWRELMPELAENFTVIAFDLPGLGSSEVPDDGFDKATTAGRIRQAVHQLGFREVSLLGHDMGALVAFPYARDHPTEVDRVAILETPLPGFPVEEVYDASWHVKFNVSEAPVPESLIDDDDVGTYLDAVFGLSPDPSAIDVDTYREAYQDPERRTAGYEYFRAFFADAENNQANAHRRLAMPVLGVGAEHSFGAGVAQALTNVADDVRSVLVPDSGHYVPEENPEFLAECTALFFGPAGVAAPRPELAGCTA